ncbi:MAG TPA: sialidase family protein, partial [Ktedonobacterales bacterium]
VPLPPTAGHVDSLVTSPTDPQAALACAGPQSDPKTYETQDGPITFWRTRDGGQHWQPLPIPAITGTYCTAQVAAGAPQRLLLVVNGMGGCQATHPLLSTDGGQHWRVLAPPLPPLPAKMQYCSLGASVSPHHLYAAVSVTVLVSVTTTRTSNSSGESITTQTTTWNTRSDDDGRTWTAPANDLPPEATPLGSLSSMDGQTITLAAGYAERATSPTDVTFGTRFWRSRDAGASWQPQGILPNFSAQWLLAPPGVTLESASVRMPVYAVSGTEIPWENLRLQAAEIRGHTWAPLPPLPVGGASAERTGITVALGATPDGQLLVLGLGPHTTLPAGGSFEDLKKLAQGLWEWDPVAARWSAITPALPVPWPAQCATPCWQGEISVGADPQGNGMYLWLASLGGFGDASPTLLRVRLPAEG